jgi:hypothetical protein
VESEVPHTFAFSLYPITLPTTNHKAVPGILNHDSEFIRKQLGLKLFDGKHDISCSETLKILVSNRTVLLNICNLHRHLSTGKDIRGF